MCSFIGKLYQAPRIEKKITLCVHTDRERGVLSKKVIAMDKGEGERKVAKVCGHPLWVAPFPIDNFV